MAMGLLSPCWWLVCSDVLSSVSQICTSPAGTLTSMPPSLLDRPGKERVAAPARVLQSAQFHLSRSDPAARRKHLREPHNWLLLGASRLFSPSLLSTRLPQGFLGALDHTRTRACPESPFQRVIHAGFSCMCLRGSRKARL